MRSPKDGMYYMAVHNRRPYMGMDHGSCMLRTADVADVRSWRGWNGTSFSVRFADPYAAGFDPQTASAHACAPSESIPTLTILSLKWSSFYGAFLGVGQGVMEGRGRVPWYQFSLSDDLVHWSQPVPIRPMQDNATIPPSVQNYASVLDPAS